MNPANTPDHQERVTAQILELRSKILSFGIAERDVGHPEREQKIAGMNALLAHFDEFFEVQEVGTTMTALELRARDSPTP